MAEKPGRRRIEIPWDVYQGIEAAARWLHISVAAYVTIILDDAVRADRKGLRKIFLARTNEPFGVAGLTREEEREVSAAEQAARE